ncbi:MAG: phosphatidylserine decarboxylase family protein [Microscillaceae bacterium]|jgi:phosphatidylserine decarboxylase|nr:phosphatidylserine decarboxylase family protein [Microscillaceae bacterium]
MKIHREGRLLLAILAGIGLILIVAAIYTRNYLIISTLIVYLIFFGLILQFFRHPSRTTPQNENQLIAPADGKIVTIEKTFESEYLQQECYQISIFMSPFNVHVNRNPVSGKIVYFKYHAGKYLVAWHPKSSTENERTTLVYETKQQKMILVRQIAGAVARRICWYVAENQSVIQGEEFGFIKFGSRVDVFLPLNADLKVQIGDKTRGGETVLVEWK